MLLLLLLVGVQGIIDYPFGCDCSEHTSMDVCQAHYCGWKNGQCISLECNERVNNQAICENGSQFYSQNPHYCVYQNQQCVKFQKCEDIHLSMNSIQGREYCQKYFCAYDAVSGYCFKPQECKDIYDENTCNYYLIKKDNNIQQICYWNDGCEGRDTYIKKCQEIREKGMCQALGCFYNGQQCQEITCESRNIKDCNGEYVNQHGKVLQCLEKGEQCISQDSNLFNKKQCNEMIGHTWNGKECKKCKSYQVHSKVIL